MTSTSIRIDKKTRKTIKTIRTKNQSFDNIINEILDKYEKLSENDDYKELNPEFEKKLEQNYKEMKTGKYHIYENKEELIKDITG